MTKSVADCPWSVPVAVHDVPETGRRFELAADEHSRSGIAKLAGLRDLPRLEGTFDVTRHAAGLHVVGRVSACVGQTCVVTLEPIENEIAEDVDLTFVADAGKERRTAAEVDLATDDGPERIVGGTVDLGAVATEFLVLGIDPYPRKPEAVFEPPPADDGSGKPFAALAAIKQERGRHGG